MQHRNLEPVFQYLGQLLKQYKQEMDPNRYQYCAHIVHTFHQWYLYHALSANDLYLLLMNQENTDSISIFDCAQCSSVEECGYLYYVWNSILSILMVMVYVAYEFEGSSYIPQDIEQINPQKVDRFFEQIEKKITPKELLELHLKELCY